MCGWSKRVDALQAQQGQKWVSPVSPQSSKNSGIPSLSVTVRCDTINTNSSVENPGALLNHNLSLHHCIISMFKAANFQLYRLSVIQKYITREALCNAESTLISFRFDYCNSLLFDLHKTHIAPPNMTCPSVLRSVGHPPTTGWIYFHRMISYIYTTYGIP